MIDISKIIRFLKSEHKGLDLSSYFRLNYVLGYPCHATIELTNLCNLRCPVCENRSSIRKKGNMSLAAFQAIIDELGPHLEDLELSGFGEVFINADIYQMIKYIRQINPRTYVYLDTNGHFMDTRRLLESPPDELVFSIDGLDQQTYEKYRINGKLDVVLKNLRSCVESKKKVQSHKPLIIIKFICMKHNEHQLAQVPQFCQEVGADDYRLELFTSRTAEQAHEFMSSIPAYQRYSEAHLKDGLLIPHMKQIDAPCPKIWRQADIYWNGDVVPCCVDSDGLFTWGNIFKEGSFRKIWNGQRARAFRKAHRRPSYRDEISICRGCYLFAQWDENIRPSLSLEKSGRDYYTISKPINL